MLICSNTIDTCKFRGGDIPERIGRQVSNEDQLYGLVEFFKVFGDSTRIRALYRLFLGEHSVNELAEGLNLTQPAVSHQLRLLKQAGLVWARRGSKSMMYAPADDHMSTMVGQGLEHAAG